MKTKRFFAFAMEFAACMMLSSFMMACANNNASTGDNDDEVVEEESLYEDESKNAVVEGTQQSSWAGTYSFTDADGVKLKVVLKNDETAVLYMNGKDIDYGSWMVDKYAGHNYACVFFSDFYPKIKLPNGEKEFHKNIFLKDGYAYTSSCAADGNHPKKRLKYTKSK